MRTVAQNGILLLTILFASVALVAVGCGGDGVSGSSSGQSDGGATSSSSSSSSSSGSASSSSGDSGSEEEAYSVGGTVYGLGGATGLSLSLNGGAALAITSDGPFVFPTKLTSSSTYTVTIASQPGKKTCTVSAGSGTVAKTDVTSVLVNCDPNTFTLGGTLSGLADGATLTLSNGGTTLVRDANGPFVFPTPLPTDTSYAVTVSVQPTNPTQECSVANGSGVIGTSNVTDIQVTCVTSTFTVGGNVSGLAGGTLTLQINGDETVTVTADGPFTFPTPIESGEPYVVSVLAPPVMPTQQCTIASGSGTVTDANVTGVTVTCVTSTFTIGGTLTGLQAGKTIELALGSEKLTRNADGAFTFPTPLQSGTGFSVSIATQPVGQTCDVSGASGTVGSADVSSVVVNCETNSYTVGGTVSGLIGVVSLRARAGGEAIIVSANGDFAFPTPLLSGSTYEVTVTAHPSSPAQTCTIDSGTGTIGGANVTNVSVVCTTNRYAIGGTVTGLAPNQSVVLRNNDGDDLTVTADAAGVAPPFVFGTLVESGATYAVTVFDHPASPIAQTCEVTGGNGLVTNTAVTNVVVTCTANRYTIGGTVTGLANGGTVVLANGAVTLDVTGGGSSTTSFTFPDSIPSGTSYEVTVQSSPTTPFAQTCTVTSGGVGTVTNTNVTNIAVSCTINTYPVQVEVSGHSSITNTPGGSSALILQNNGADDLTVTTNGTVPFSAQIQSGSPYKVTVSSAPSNPQQTCNVTDGEGTVTDGPVTVKVTCSRTTVSVAGTVYGLAEGKGIVLSNGTENVTVNGPSNNATSTSFAFTTPIENGSSYNVTIATQPSTAGGPAQSQDCQVQHPSGAIPTFNPTNTNLEIYCGRTCASIKRANPSAGTAHGYSIDPDGQGGNDPFNAHCDMVFDGGGWTAIMKMWSIYGPAETEVVTDVLVGIGRRLSDTRVQQLARLSRQVHLRQDFDSVAANTLWLTSTPDTVPIQNLRNLKILNYGVPANDFDLQRSYWTVNREPPTMLHFTLVPQSEYESWPSIYQANGNTSGLQLYGTLTSTWWGAPGSHDGGSKRVYVR